MFNPPPHSIAQYLPEELDTNAVKIAQLATMLMYLLNLYSEYYAQLLHEVAPFSSDIPGTVERMQSELSEMESHTRSLSSLLKTFQPRSPFWLKTLRSDDFQDFCRDEAGKFFL